MTGTFSAIFGWVRDKILSYFLIAAVLILGAWAQGEISKMVEYEKQFNLADHAIQRIDKELQQIRSGSDPVSKAYALALFTLQKKELERDDYFLQHPILTNFWKSDVWQTRMQFESEIKALKSIVATKEQLVGEKIKALSAMRQAQEALKAEYEEYLKWARKWKELLPTFWLAAAILFSAIAVGIAIKVFLYFVVAPIASRRPPIQILPDVNGAIRSGLTRDAGGDSGKVSLVSIPLVLKANQELLVRPEYLQSTSYRANKKTQWLLNSAFPYASLLSGMFLLTKVQSPEADEVVVSPTRDPLGEICVIDLPDEAAFVCQPRALVGIIQDQARPIRITRHWRLGSLQSWLTLQLRFLVFHGPGQLIVKGCRGVRMESAGKGRLINQSATLGFSANIYYANTRCETFISYWMGKEDLFNDIFTGELGSYVYEEMPDYKHKNGIAGRGLEGLLDAGLKLFGI